MNRNKSVDKRKLPLELVVLCKSLENQMFNFLPLVKPVNKVELGLAANYPIILSHYLINIF